MDLSALPNNNHPEKLLQLDVKALPASQAMVDVGSSMGAALAGQKQWHNRVYYQLQSPPAAGRPGTVARALQKHITPATLEAAVKTNPLYSDTGTDGCGRKRSKPSWTIQEYDRHSLCSSLADYLKENPRDLNFWLEDLYTPGFDSLLKKKEAEQRRNKVCKIASFVVLLSAAVVLVIVVPVVVTRNKD
ncbi:hypothetical protein GN956_G21299 [Arapaima gigas]